MTQRQCLPWSCDGEQVLIRPYGDHPADLNVPLAGGFLPELVTGLLTACVRDQAGQPLPEDRAWGWTVSGRLQGLLGIAAASLGPNQLVETRCQVPSCRAALDIEVDLSHFAGMETTQRLSTHSAGRRLELRMPTGLDHRQWLSRPDAPPTAEALAASLVEAVDGEPPAADWRPLAPDLERIERLLAEHDPLNDLRVDAACPECGEPVCLELDLEGWLLSRLRYRQAWLLDEIHALASAYHWSEAEIFALPTERRQAYLQRIDGGGW